MKVLGLKFLTIGLLGYFAVTCLQKSTSIIDGYDASFFAVVARNLAFYHHYGACDNGVFITCPNEATTGPALLLPVAAAYRCFGDWPFLPGVVSAVFCLSVLAFAWAIAAPGDSRQSTWHFFSLLVAMIVMLSITVKQFDHRFFYASQGDALAGLLLLAMTVALGRENGSKYTDFWSALSGICAALAMNTKFITVLPLTAWAAFVVLSAAYRWIPRRAAVVMLAAFVATGGCFVLFNLWQLGSLRAYLTNLRQFCVFFCRPGSGMDASKSPLGQLFANHLDTYFHEFGWCGLVLLLPLLYSPVCLYRLMRGRGSVDGWMGVGCSLQILPLLAWWFCYSDLSWTRHIAPILVLLPFACHFLLSDVWRQTRSRFSRAAIVGVWPISLVVACVLSPSAVWNPPRLSPGPHQRTVALLEFARDIEALRREQPDARFWGSGWWRHWDVQLVSHLTCLNVLQPPKDTAGPGRENHDYMIVSDYFNWEHNPVATWVVERNRNNIVFSRGVFQLYHLKPPPAAAVKASASHENPASAGRTLEALNNGSDPLLRFTWGDQAGTQEWVQYDFPAATRVSAAEVYWYDDTVWNGHFGVPESWQLLYKEGTDWKAVENAGEFGTKPDAFNRVTFKPVSTTALRLVARLRGGFRGGILEWKAE
ncbi:MAG: hypothetical protein ABSA16_08995 [Thermoguttaceae bacterium]|jgi:hypothetical protein